MRRARHEQTAGNPATALGSWGSNRLEYDDFSDSFKRALGQPRSAGDRRPATGGTHRLVAATNNMVNNIKASADGLALQVTKQARKAGLVEEGSDGKATRLSGVYVYGFDGLLVVLDAERVSTSDRAELVASATQDTGSIHRGTTATVSVAGNGYQVQLPDCQAAGFHEGDRGVVQTADGVLVIHDGSNRRLAGDLVTIRSEQV